MPERDFDPEVVARLEEDSVITRDEERHLVSPVHDVFEDWALEEYIQQEYFSNHEDPSQFLTAIGSEPAINRAFRLWLYQKLVDGDLFYHLKHFKQITLSLRVDVTPKFGKINWHTC